MSDVRGRASAAYYNEHDPFAAAWLRELIKAGHIAPGDVDERSIEDVCPDELAGYVQCHFFAGIGVWSHALRLAGWPDDRAIWTGSCPCQPFSSAGKGAGFDDERHLWPAFFDLIEQCDPPVVIGEQVASKDGLAWLDLVSADVEGSGRAFAAADLCAAGFGAPHIRQRSFWVAHHDHAERGAGSARWHDRDRADARRPQGSGDIEGRGRAVGLGNADSDEQGAQRRHLGEVRGLPVAECKSEDGPALYGRGGPTGGLGFADDAGCQPRGAGSAPVGHGNSANSAGAFGGLADLSSKGRRPRRARLDTAHRDGALRFGPQEPGRCDAIGIGHNGAPSAHSFWSDADWLGCRDGKWRPVEPGTFPLAHGAANRVGRLRGYGNAIVGPVAQGFIEAVMDHLQQQRPFA